MGLVQLGVRLEIEGERVGKRVANTKLRALILLIVFAEIDCILDGTWELIRPFRLQTFRVPEGGEREA